MSAPSKAHDTLFHALMANPRMAKDFFSRHLPEVIKESVNLETLYLCKESFIDDELKSSVIDLLFKVDFNSNPGYLYTLVEHQSSVDKAMPFRILKYMVRIMEHHIQEHKEIKLPVIYPIVLYHGKVSYYGPTDIFDLFGEHQELARMTLFSPFKLIDLTKVEDEELKKHLWSGTMEFVFKHIFVRDVMQWLQGIKEQLQLLERESVNSNVLIHLLEYIIMYGETGKKSKVIDFVKATFSEQTAREMTTIAGLFREEGKQEGIMLGKQEGKQEGIMLGKQEGLLQVAMNMLEMGQNIDFIIELTGLSEQAVKKLASKIVKH